MRAARKDRSEVSKRLLTPWPSHFRLERDDSSRRHPALILHRSSGRRWLCSRRSGIEPWGSAAPSHAAAGILAALRRWKEPVALSLLASRLACTTDGLCFLPGLAL